MKKKLGVNWSVVLYLAKKLISKFGYVCGGAFLALIIEYGAEGTLIFGAALGFLLGIVATIDNEDPTL